MKLMVRLHAVTNYAHYFIRYKPPDTNNFKYRVSKEVTQRGLNHSTTKAKYDTDRTSVL